MQGIYGNYEAAESFLSTATSIDPEDDRLPEVRSQVGAMKAGGGPSGGQGQGGQGGEGKGHNVPGLITGHTLTAGFSAALLEIFSRFDKDNDRALSPNELNAFTRLIDLIIIIILIFITYFFIFTINKLC